MYNVSIMAKILTPAPHFTLSEVERHYRQEHNATVSKHWQIIRLMLKGHKAQEVAEGLALSDGWVKEIIRRYNRLGAAGLRDRRKDNGGHNALLSEDQQKELLRIVKEEEPKDGGLWTGPKIASWIEQTIGKKIRKNTGWDYLVRLGFSLRIARPRHLKSNKEEQEEFKKNFIKK